MKLSLLHATRGRPDRCLAVREEWMSKAGTPKLVEHIFGIDADDDMTVEAVLPYHAVVVLRPKGCFRAYNLAAAASTGDILIPIEDDLHPEDGWDDNIRHAMQFQWDRVAMLAVGDGQNKCIEWCVTRKFYEERGLFHDDYYGLFGDTEWRFRARLDRIPTVPAPSIIFHHNQFKPGGSASDLIYERKQGRYLDDEMTFNKRGRAGWPE